MTRRYIHSRSETVTTALDSASPRMAYGRPTAPHAVASAGSPPPPRLVLQLAAQADCDPRSARKALEEGADAVRGKAGERIVLAAQALGIDLPDPSNLPPSAA